MKNFFFSIRNREQNGKTIKQDYFVFIEKMKTAVVALATQPNNAAVFFESLVVLANAGCRDSQVSLAEVLSLNPNQDYYIVFYNNKIKLTSEFKEKIISSVDPIEQQEIIQIVFNNMSNSQDYRRFVCMLNCANFFVQYSLINTIFCLKEIIVKGEEAAQAPAIIINIASSFLTSILNYKSFSLQEAQKVIEIIQDTPYRDIILQIKEDDIAQPTLSLGPLSI